MSSISLSTSVIISLLCLISLNTSVSASRRLNGVVVVNQEPPRNTTYEEAMKNIKKVNMDNTTNINPSQVNATKSDYDEQRVNLHKKANEYHDEHVMNRINGRQDRARRASKTSSKLVKRKIIPRVVTWRVPRPKDEVSQTSFNLDYAPPKVHPPTHN